MAATGGSTFKNNNTDPKKTNSFDLLDITASLGYQTYRRNGRNSWTREDDEELLGLINDALKQFGYPNGIVDVKTVQESLKIVKLLQWDILCANFSNKSRTAKDLRKRWSGSLDPNVKKGRWTKEEDELLLKSYEKHGPHWLSVSMEIAGRTEDQCAKRYVEVLGPSSKGRLRDWSQEEDLLLISKVKKYGTKWRRISNEMEFRPSLTCRNRWRKIITMVVREQAPEIIMTAVKENKELDLTNDKSKNETSTKQTKETGASSSMTDKIRNDEPVSRTPSLSNINIGYNSTEVKTKPLNEAFASPPPSILSQPSRLTNSLPPLPNVTPVPGRILQINHRSVDDVRKSPLSGTTPPGRTSPALRMDLHSSSQPNLHSNFLLNDSSTTNTTTTNNNNNTTYQYSSTTKEPGITSGIENNHSNIVPPSRPSPAPHVSQTEWKFILKDGKGLSISNGTINTSELVNELIEQAKKYSLKISLHQHIHHHYESTTGSRHNEFEPRPDGLISQFQKNNDIPTNHTSPSMSSTNLSNIQASLFPDLVDRQLTSQSTTEANDKMGFIPNSDKTRSIPMDFKTGLSVPSQTGPFSPNYHHLGLDLSPSPIPGNNLINDINDQFTTAGNQNSSNKTGDTNNDTIYFNSSNDISVTTQPQNIHNTSSNTSSSYNAVVATTTTSNNTTNQDVNTNRSSHFNYLPPTIRPQLESSDTQTHSGRNASLSKLLNPSPGAQHSSSSPGSSSSTSQQRRKRKRRRTRSSNSGNSRPVVKRRTSSMSSSHNKSQIDAITSNHNNNTGNSISPASPTHEDGVDFWETLRSLADNPTIKDDDDTAVKAAETRERHNTEVENMSSLFDRKIVTPGKEDTTNKHEDEHAIHSDNENIDPLLPLNAS